MIEALVVVVHALRQVFGKQRAGRLHDAIRKVMGQELEASAQRVEPPLDRIQSRQPIGAQVLNGQESVLAVRLRNGERVAVEVFPLERQRFEMRQDVAADLCELRRVARPDIEVADPSLLRKGIESDGEQHDLARAAG